MKLTKIIFKLLVFMSIGITQAFAQGADPSVNGATINPAPLPAPGATGSNNVSVYFNFLNVSTSAIPLNTLNVINVSLKGLDVNGTFSTATNIAITGGDYFSFTYNPANTTLTATQKAIIPGLAGEVITLKGLIVTSQSDRSNPQNGLNVNVVFLRTFNSLLNNDHTDAFTFTGSGGTTPIRLLNFSGIKEVNRVQLQWQTSSEQNSSYFDVEFSADGVQWSSIGKVNAADISTTTRSYSLLHNSPVDGTNYYRLKQVDKAGNFIYSNIIAIKFTITGLHVGSIYPNPFMDKIKIDVSSDRAETVYIQLSDNLGRVIKVLKAPVQKGVNQLWLESLSGLAPGIYNVEVKTASSTFRYKLKK